MNYFAPESIFNFGPPKKNVCRLAQFVIEPINNQYSSELYWLTSYYCDNGKYYTRAYNHKEFEINSPAFDSEKKAIKWLEAEMIALVTKKLNEHKKKLLTEIQSNNRYLKNLIKEKQINV
jgi:hypothetical protein